MQAHPRLLSLENQPRELTRSGKLRMGTAEIGQTIWTRSSLLPVAHWHGLEIVEQLGDITCRWPPAHHWYPVTPVTVPIIHTSSAQPASPHRRPNGPAVAGQPLGEGAAGAPGVGG